MQLSRALEDKKFDVRLRDKLGSDGKMSKEQLEEYLNTLPDDAAQATFTDEAKKESN